MKDYDKVTLMVNYNHLLQYDQMLATAISEEYYRYAFPSLDCS